MTKNLLNIYGNQLMERWEVNALHLIEWICDGILEAYNTSTLALVDPNSPVTKRTLGFISGLSQNMQKGSMRGYYFKLKDVEKFENKYIELLKKARELSQQEKSPEPSEKIKVDPENKNIDTKATKTESQTEKLIWKGTNTQLVYLFDKLEEEDLLERGEHGYFYAVMIKFFKRKDGKPLNSRSLAQASQNRTYSKVRGSNEIDNIINEIKSNK